MVHSLNKQQNTQGKARVLHNESGENRDFKFSAAYDEVDLIDRFQLTDPHIPLTNINRLAQEKQM